MAPLITTPSTTEHASSSSPYKKKTRRGGMKKPKMQNFSNEMTIEIDEDEEPQTNNTVGIVSLLDGETSSFEPSATQNEAANNAINEDIADEDDDMLLDISPPSAPPVQTSSDNVPVFAPLPAHVSDSALKKSETRRIPIPPHRMTPLKKDWVQIFVPVTEMAGLQVRMNVHRRTVEIRVRLQSI